MTIRFLSLAALMTLPLFESGTAMAQEVAREERVANAISAAPESITRDATIMDWPATEGGEMMELRAGTNGWTCLPDLPSTDGNDPMCVDQTWMDFMNAVMSRTTPQVDRVGIGYMTAPGGAYGSNTDPHATGPTPDNEWGFDPPHVMIVVPDTTHLRGYPTTRQTGSPWVMFSGTPYAHLMVPLADPEPEEK